MKYFKPFEAPIPPVFPGKCYDIRDYGAVGDAKTKCTEAINVAILECSKNGGGKVIIPNGEWLTGAIHLKSGVELQLEENAKVSFSTVFEDYLPAVYGILAGIRVYSASHFIYARDCHDIAITGTGTFDGNGYAWWHIRNKDSKMADIINAGKEGIPVEQRVYDKKEDKVRPRMLQLVNCKNILIDGVTFQNSPSWTVHPAWCENITIRNVIIRNPLEGAPNTDGINLDSCRRALIEHCNIETTGDDAFCLKAGRDRDAREVGIPCEDIEIRNCTAKCGHGGLTIGSETSASIRNAYLHDCTFGSMYSGVRIKTMQGRGGFVENIDFENIKIKKASDGAITITMRYDGEPLDDHKAKLENMPEVKNISVTGFSCENADKGIVIIGEKGYEIRNVILEDVTVKNSENGVEIVNTDNLLLENVRIG